MKSAKELSILPQKKFEKYINTECELNQLARFAMSEEFAELQQPYRLYVEQLLFSHFGKLLPETDAWEQLMGSTIEGRVISAMPNRRFRRATIRINLWGYDLVMMGSVELPPNKAGQYNAGAQIPLEITREFGVFKFADRE